LNSARQTGGVTGVALLGALYATDHGAGLAGGLLIAAGGCVAALLLASRWVPPAPVADGTH
jgi:CHASE2 domain-containing sensor protein